jgi:hypothetical protein
MALERNKDYVFAPVIDIITEKGTFVGTRDYLYVVPDKSEVDEGFLASVLSDTVTYESLQIGGKAPREYIGEILNHSDTTLESLHKFFLGLQKKWDAVNIVKLHELKKLKVMATILGGSIAIKFEGKMGFTPLISRIRKDDKYTVKNFYEEIMKEIDAR